MSKQYVVVSVQRERTRAAWIANTRLFPNAIKSDFQTWVNWFEFFFFHFDNRPTALPVRASDWCYTTLHFGSTFCKDLRILWQLLLAVWCALSYWIISIGKLHYNTSTTASGYFCCLNIDCCRFCNYCSCCKKMKLQAVYEYILLLYCTNHKSHSVPWFIFSCVYDVDARVVVVVGDTKLCIGS